ncbi:MAG: UDP-N-acetylmuramoyl-tripeptide--D-alanyl-D-alanine ligase [Balneolaceae bacterium]|nr:UDP-N-acetylmuramoyl-tripeptide--D-alanyl-D-alanine ligase [Balneolaceae bacterium]
MIAVFIRHSLHRLRFFLHMFQQLGYKTNELRQWLSGNLFAKVFTTEHLLYSFVIMAMFYFVAERITLTAGAIIMSIFTIFWFLGTSRYKPEKEKKPLVYTPRMKRLAGTLFVLFVLLWFFLIDFSFNTLPMRDFAAPFIHTDPYFIGFTLLFADILVPLILYIGAWFLKPVEATIQNGFKRKARKKLASMPDLKVIAITGSYGKTSTKFVIHSFLKERMNVCVTPGSYNTPMGICKVINNDLNAQHNVLILEMGARYEGNIKELCDIARPDIAVLTNIGVAHLETFGSQEAIVREKSTLARELKKGGTLVLNGDDPHLQKLKDFRDDVKIVLTGENGTITASDVEVSPAGTEFSLNWLDRSGAIRQSEKIKTKLLGAHNIQNFLLGAAVVSEFGIRPQTVALAAAGIEPVEHRLQLKQRNGLLVIDDAFNSNPIGAKNAVDILVSFKNGRKIIITPGMIELGELEYEENKKFGEHIGLADIDLVILVGKERTRPILEGITSSIKGNNKEVQIVDTLFEANDILNDYARAGDIVLYENDLPDTFSS